MKFINFLFPFFLLWHGIKRTTLSSKGFLKSRVWRKFRILIYWHATLRRGGPLAAKGNYESTSVAYWISIVRQELKEILVPFLPSECLHKVPLQHFRRHIFSIKICGNFRLRNFSILWLLHVDWKWRWCLQKSHNERVNHVWLSFCVA